MSKHISSRLLVVIELLAVIFNLLYTILYIQHSQNCFYYAMIGSTLFVFLCFKKRIYAESFLQLFYIGFAVFGLLNSNAEWSPVHWSLWTHLMMITAGVAIMYIAGKLLLKFTDAKLPMVDAFTTVFSIIATWVMVNFVHENWLYWIVINAVSIYLYSNRKLYFGTVLFVIYFILSIVGYFEIPLSL